MFDEQQEKLLNAILRKTQRDYQTHNTVYEVSGFDAEFDEELKKLVVHYSFDFQAIALYMSFKYHQYSHRLKPQAVSYRWYQLQRESFDPVVVQSPPKQEIQKRELVGQPVSDRKVSEEEQEIQFYSLELKKQNYQLAMRMASQLDEEEEEGFMVYRPKFIIDSEFKLERKKTVSSELMEAVSSEAQVQFGEFEPPQAAPGSQLMIGGVDAGPLNQLQAEGIKMEAQEEDYFDEDWEAYESD